MGLVVVAQRERQRGFRRHGDKFAVAQLAVRLWLAFIISADIGFCIAFGQGFYDGFFGPGTGSFLLFAFLMVGFDFIGAAANARALNFASNISASLLFAYFGLVEFSYVIPMGLAMIAGAWCGAHMALKKGTGYVRPLFVIMTTVLIGKQLIDLWK